MENPILIDKIISKERMMPYLARNQNDLDKAILHYKINILISEAFYPLLSVLEIGLRNSIDYQLTKAFNDRQWFECDQFVKFATNYQTNRIAEARKSLVQAQKEYTPGRMISELPFGFWTSLFDAHFEKTLWKNLRLAFPNCPKQNRKRKAMSTKFNSIRKLRNRIFHHEAISWSLVSLNQYKQGLSEGIEWLDKDLLAWTDDLNQLDYILGRYQSLIHHYAL